MMSWKTTIRKEDATLNWRAKRMIFISFRAGQSCRVQRVNGNKKACMEACCCRETTRNNMRGAGKCGVKYLMEMSVCWCAYSRFVVLCSLVFLFFWWMKNFSFFSFGKCRFKYGKFKSVKLIKSS